MLLDILKLNNNIINFYTVINKIYILPSKFYNEVNASFNIYDLDPSKTPLPISVYANDFKEIVLGIVYNHGFRISVSELEGGQVLLDVDTTPENINKLRTFIPDYVNVVSKFVYQPIITFTGFKFTYSDYKYILVTGSETRTDFSFQSKLTLFYPLIDVVIKFNDTNDTPKRLIGGNFFFFLIPINTIYVKSYSSSESGYMHVWLQG
jgi:hypothetical protein